jgi:hypothetical protein
MGRICLTRLLKRSERKEKDIISGAEERELKMRAVQ